MRLDAAYAKMASIGLLYGLWKPFLLFVGNRDSSDKYRGQPISVEQHSTMAQYFSNLGAVLE